jgi:hypothetical protein
MPDGASLGLRGSALGLRHGHYPLGSKLRNRLIQAQSLADFGQSVCRIDGPSFDASEQLAPIVCAGVGAIPVDAELVPIS